MKSLKPTIVKNATSVLLLILTVTSATAQTSFEIFKEPGNTLVLKLKNDSKPTIPDKIVLVYDSNMISLEPTSPTVQRLLNENYPVVNILPVSILPALSEVDYEADMELEDWMLKPFINEKSNTDLTPDIEEEMPVEPWMTDLGKWN
ncbi:MAG: hypothetical protein JXB34_08645 [Bacteroidales bacterium]|nr:hypothetical protein [Bacteroidales bacterium]